MKKLMLLATLTLFAYQGTEAQTVGLPGISEESEEFTEQVSRDKTNAKSGRGKKRGHGRATASGKGKKVGLPGINQQSEEFLKQMASKKKKRNQKRDHTK